MVEERKDENAVIKVLNLLKKPADILDDGWNAVRKFVPEAIGGLIGAFLIGSLFFIIHMLEAYNAVKEFIKIYHNEQIAQRKTRYLASILSFIFAGAGFGLSISYILGALTELGVLSLTVSGMAFFPVLIPGLLAGIYSLSLWKHSYVLHRAKEDESNAKQAYEQYIANPNHDPEEAGRLFEAYKNAYDKRLEAEREVALTTLEVVGSLFVCIGILLGSAAILGAASVASFGALPLALLITGVVIGCVSKWIEYKDEKQNSNYTKGMRNFFRKKFGLPDDDPELAKRHAPKMQAVQRQMSYSSNSQKGSEKEVNHVSSKQIKNEKQSTHRNVLWNESKNNEVTVETDHHNPRRAGRNAAGSSAC